MPSIAVRSDGPYVEERPLEDTYYVQSYIDLALALEERDTSLYLTKDDATYLGGNRFLKGWIIRNGRMEKVHKPFTVDLIYNKDKAFFPSPDANVVNDKAFDALCNDKKRVAELFSDISPQTILVQERGEVEEALASIPSSMVVVKPQSSYGGQGVFIGKKKEANAHIETFPYLMQEFIDTSGGIPGITSTHHDFRMIVMDGEIAFTFIRTPRKGFLISNLARGGWMTPVPPHLRPHGAIELAEHVDRECTRFRHRIYSVDCAKNSDGRWLLIELNAPPGQQSRLECGDDADTYFQKHVAFLLRAAQERVQ